MLFRQHLGLITVCISVSFIVMHEQAQLCSLECTATSVLFSPMYCRPTLERYLYNRMSNNGRESTLKTPNMPRTNTNEATLHLGKEITFLGWASQPCCCVSSKCFVTRLATFFGAEEVSNFNLNGEHLTCSHVGNFWMCSILPAARRALAYAACCGGACVDSQTHETTDI